MPPFPQAARAALADTQLRTNLAHATATIRAKRDRVVAEVDDWEALRGKAARIKDETLAHLDEYLEQLEGSLTARGAVVHWARDAARHNNRFAKLAARGTSLPRETPADGRRRRRTSGLLLGKEGRRFF